LRAYRLSADGRPAWGSQGVPLSDPAATGHDFSSFGQLDDGRLRAVWVHEQGASSAVLDVYLAELTLAGERLVPPAGLPLSTQPRQQLLSGFAYDAERRVGLALYADSPDAFTTDLGAWDMAATLYEPSP
jgi:hypothetical protein